MARNVPSPIKETEQLSRCSVSDKRNPAIVVVNLNGASAPLLSVMNDDFEAKAAHLVRGGRN